MKIAKYILPFMVITALSLTVIGPALAFDEYTSSTSLTAANDDLDLTLACGGSGTAPPPEAARPDGTDTNAESVFI